MQNDKVENSVFSGGFPEVSYPPSFPEALQILLVAGSVTSLANIAVSSEEDSRAAGMTSMEVRDRFLAGRRIVRGVFSNWLGQAPEQLPILIGEDGKPFLKAGDHFHFSITHAKDLVVAAFSRDPVGADLECERGIDAPALAGRFFSNQESVAVRENPALFFPFWTRREAAAKADGRGLAKTLSITSLEENPIGEWQSVSIGKDVWKTLSRKAGPFHLALATRQVPSSILWCDLRAVIF